MTPEQQAALAALGQFHPEPEPKTTAEQLLEAADRFVKPDGTFDAIAYLDHLNALP
jgi:hypothetical protein